MLLPQDIIIQLGENTNMGWNNTESIDELVQTMINLETVNDDKNININKFHQHRNQNCILSHLVFANEFIQLDNGSFWG
eukprot:UN05988